MSQEAFIRDVLKNWAMTNCRPLVVPGEVATVALPEEEEADPEVRREGREADHEALREERSEEGQEAETGEESEAEVKATRYRR